MIQLYYQLHIGGKAVTRRRICKSYVSAFMRRLMAQFSQVGENCADITNSVAGYGPSAYTFSANDDLDSDIKGIVVGTGSTAVASTDYALEAKIATGSGSGELRYLAATFNGPFEDSTGTWFQIIRAFVNNDSSSLTVNEIGLYGYDNANSTAFCHVRDVIGGGVAVPAGETLTVTYTLKTVI